MINPTAPDWAEPNAKAYILRHHLVAGVGSYLTAHQVRITATTNTLVRVCGPGTDGAVVTFRARGDELIARGGAIGPYTRDDILVAPSDPRVAECRRTGQIMTATAPAAARIEHHLRGLRVDDVDAYNDPSVVANALTALDAIIDAAEESRLRLQRVQNGA